MDTVSINPRDRQGTPNRDETYTIPCANCKFEITHSVNIATGTVIHCPRCDERGVIVPIYLEGGEREGVLPEAYRYAFSVNLSSDMSWEVGGHLYCDWDAYSKDKGMLFVRFHRSMSKNFRSCSDCGTSFEPGDEIFPKRTKSDVGYAYCLDCAPGDHEAEPADPNRYAECDSCDRTVELQQEEIGAEAICSWEYEHNVVVGLDPAKVSDYEPGEAKTKRVKFDADKFDDALHACDGCGESFSPDEEVAILPVESEDNVYCLDKCLNKLRITEGMDDR